MGNKVRIKTNSRGHQSPREGGKRRVVVRRQSQDIVTGNPEEMLIASILNTKDYQSPIQAGVGVSWFHAFDAEWDWIEQYVRRHRTCPSKGAFLRKFPDFKIANVNDVGHFIDEVRTAHARQTLVNVTNEVVNGLRDQANVLDLVRKTEVSLIKLQSDVEGKDAESDLVLDWQETYDEVARRVGRSLKQGHAGIPTGFPTLDMATGGPQPGEYWVVAARLGGGKTWTLIRMATSALFSGHKVMYYALEQSRSQISMRIHTFMSSKYGKQTFKALDLATGKNVDLIAYKRFLAEMKDQMQGQCIINDTSRGRLSTAQMASQIERHRPDIIFLDYITLLSGDADWQSISQLSAEINQLSAEYDVPIVVAAQINRMGANTKDAPGTETLAGSDAIARDADAVVTMTKMTKHVLRFKLAKYRHGEDGQTWYTEFAPNTGKFIEISGDEARTIMDADRDAEGDD